MRLKPLSPLNYYYNNKRKAIPVIICAATCVFFIYVFSMYVQAVFETDNYVIASDKYFSFVSSLTDKSKINEDLIRKIKENENTEKVIPCNVEFTNFNMPLGGDNILLVYKVTEDDMNFMICRMELKLVEGKIPNRENEIVLHSRLAKSKGLQVGDKIGHEVNEGEALNGVYTVAGIVDGESIISLISSSEREAEGCSALAVFHKKDKLVESNDFLINSIKTSGIDVETYSESLNRQQNDNGQLKTILNIVQVIVVIVMTVAIVNLSYLHFFHRRKEFGILQALGCSGNEITKKVFREIGILQLVGYVLGLVLAIVAGIYIKNALFDKRGLPFQVISLQAFMQTAVIPIFICIFNIVPVSRLLKRIDPIAIAQGKE
jgi:ABC-type lipoprotein release transport system permease subunit